ncbi:alpha amylase C-terminal domain-containing protein [Hoeflea sp.]|uniref:alpha amylase C-terminal domain-containing protein n=1 Tax=Hoeflea sp. TaxID=1940281 RepID=UPI0025BBB803|nr:alpha amylase C-terminal domain-containing protein [Hoeflea sp.]
MHDTLHYIERDPLYRRWHQGELTIPMIYAYSEKYVLPISHDEVVHGKGSLLTRMPGDRWRKFANLRLYLSLMWTHPGRKLLFMGCELGMEAEWNHDQPLPWGLIDHPEHAAIQRLVRDLNRLYVSEPALHQRDSNPSGFQWLVADDSENNVFAFVRHGDGGSVAVALNMTPQPLDAYRIGLPAAGNWTEVLNSDAERYGGSNTGNGGGAYASDHPMHGQPCSAEITPPPLGAILLRHQGSRT